LLYASRVFARRRCFHQQRWDEIERGRLFPLVIHVRFGPGRNSNTVPRRFADTPAATSPCPSLTKNPIAIAKAVAHCPAKKAAAGAGGSGSKASGSTARSSQLCLVARKKENLHEILASGGGGKGELEQMAMIHTTGTFVLHAPFCAVCSCMEECHV